MTGGTMTRILFFIDTGLTGGGAERVLCNLANALDPRRFDVTVMTLWPQADTSCLAPHVRCRSLYPVRNPLTRYLYRLENQLGLAARRIREHYNLEVAYLENGSTKVIAGSKSNAKKIAWVHCDLALKNLDDLSAYVKKTAPWYEKFDRVVCVSEGVRESFLVLYDGRFPCSMAAGAPGMFCTTSTTRPRSVQRPTPSCLKAPMSPPSAPWDGCLPRKTSSICSVRCRS